MRVLLLALSATVLLWPDPADADQQCYPVQDQQVQTRNVPAGSVSDPGSQLLFLLDAGIDVTALRKFDATKTPAELGKKASRARLLNRIIVSNTHPTDAVTLLFRYQNARVEDVLSFLLVLPCRDRVSLDPFSFQIPGTTLDVRDRLFGTAPDAIDGITAAEFGNGRFLLSVTAVGAAGNDSGQHGDTSPEGDRGDFDDPEDLDVFADWLFPQELVPPDLAARCPDVNPDRIGVEPGASDTNLNPLNASAISFNYLTGLHLEMIANKKGTKAKGAHAVTAWARPAVNASHDLDAQDSSERPDQVPDFSPQDVTLDGIFDQTDVDLLSDSGVDGDGPLAPRHVLLQGSERLFLSLTSPTLVTPGSYFALRHDALGATSEETNCEGINPESLRCTVQPASFFGSPVVGGALSASPTGVPVVSAELLPLSVKDDYNGSNAPVPQVVPQVGPLPLTARDRSYRLDPAASYFAYGRFVASVGLPVDLVDPDRFAVVGLQSFRFENRLIDPGDQVGPSAADFVLTEAIAADGLEPLLVRDAPRDRLWLRLDRIVTRDFYYDATNPGPLGVGVDYDGERGSYVTLVKSVEHVGGRKPKGGIAYWLPSAASDLLP